MVEENCYLARRAKQIFPEAYDGTLIAEAVKALPVTASVCRDGKFAEQQQCEMAIMFHPDGGIKMDLIEELNDKQKEAVLAVDGPCLVIAGAGSRKNKSINT